MKLDRAHAEATFRAKAPHLIDRLMNSAGWPFLSAVCAAGNGGLESYGFTKLQEIKPTVKGSRGGFGWYQWTGPRRRAFEAWCASRSLGPTSDEANIGFLLHELSLDEAPTTAAMKAFTGSLEDGVRLFEQKYERAGVKNYAERVAWANIALDAWADAHPGEAVPGPRPRPSAPPPPVTIPGLDKPALASKTNLSAIGAVATTTVPIFTGADWRFLCLVAVLVAAFAGVIVWERLRYARAARDAGV